MTLYRARSDEPNNLVMGIFDGHDWFAEDGRTLDLRRVERTHEETRDRWYAGERTLCQVMLRPIGDDILDACSNVAVGWAELLCSKGHFDVGPVCDEHALMMSVAADYGVTAHPCAGAIFATSFVAFYEDTERDQWVANRP